MKNKLKTHKSTQKRIRVTGTGKIRRDKRRARNSRLSRMIGKATNSDEKQMELSKVSSKKVKKLLHI